MSRSGSKPDTDAWIRTIADCVPGGVVVVDGGGGVRFASSTAAQLLHTPTDEALQLAVEEIVRRLGPDDHLELEPSAERPDLVVERHRVGQARSSGCVLVLRDAVEQRAVDTDLLLANRMRGLENLYRAMAHDLKSPLHAVVLNLDLLRELMRGADLDEPVQDKMSGYLNVIQSELSRLGRSIQSLLSQTGSTAGRKRRIDLRRLQREIVTLVEPVARGKRIRVRSSVPKRSVTVLGNRDRIKQAVLNLAVNAIEAMDRRGELEFDLGSNGAGAQLEIRDDGPGVPHELESRIFDAHFTTKKTGTGIGLGVARSVARAHGGDIQLLPREPRGTIARLRLPLVASRR